MLFGWLQQKTIRLIEAALTGVAPLGLLGVVDSPRLARALAERGRRVTAISRNAPGPKRVLVALRAHGGLLPLADGTLAAVIGRADGVDGVLDDWSRVVAEGGLVVVVDRALREESSRLALACGLVDLEQRVAGRVVVTSGRVRKLG